MIEVAEDKLGQVIEALEELREDNTIPKNIKSKVEYIVSILKEETDVNIRINRVLQELEEISDDINIQSYTRTQLFNIVSVLEKI
ncbi:MAG: UPF0147 family protein [archaeon]